MRRRAGLIQAGVWVAVGTGSFAVALAARPGPRPPNAAGPTGRFVGAEACGACHEPELAAWRAGPHARASASLPAEAAPRSCLACHATGDAPGGTVSLPNVQCEACHGAGLGYAPDDVMRNPVLARALGLRELATVADRANVCGGCHSESVAAVSIAPLDIETAWRRIGHGAAVAGTAESSAGSSGGVRAREVR